MRSARTMIGPGAAAVLMAAMWPAVSAAEKAPDVVVTIKPLHGLVARVMEGVGTPLLLVSGNASPHTFSLKPSDARAINQAEVFFRVAEDVEPFTGKIMKSLPKTVRAVTLAEAPGVMLLPRRTGATFEAHDHDHGPGGKGKKKHDHAHDHGAEKEGRDGHVWLDPENAKKMTAEIAKALTAAHPAAKDKFEANAARLTADLDKLAAEITDALAPAKGKPFVVFHDAYQYFEKRFGLEAVGSITVSPEVQPSAKRLTEIRGKLAKLGASCVFAEPQFSPKLVDAVTEGTKARSGTLDPEGALVDAGPDAYHALMRGLAKSIRDCLAPSS